MTPSPDYDEKGNAIRRPYQTNPLFPKEEPKKEDEAPAWLEWVEKVSGFIVRNFPDTKIANLSIFVAEQVKLMHRMPSMAPMAYDAIIRGISKEIASFVGTDKK